MQVNADESSLRMLDRSERISEVLFTSWPASTPTSTPPRCAASSPLRELSMNRATHLHIAAAVILLSAPTSGAQVSTQSDSSEDVEQVTAEASRAPEDPL